MGWLQRMEHQLTQRRLQGYWRTRQPVRRSHGRFLHTDNQTYLNFSSNDYLGLCNDSGVIAAWQQGAACYGVGSGGSGHVTGFTQVHARFEQQLTEWLGYPRALLFTSGYCANQALLAALTTRGDRILADRFSHASLLEAAVQSPAVLRRFHHNQPESLQRLLNKPCSGETLVITEGVFSMEGDSAPLPELYQCVTASGSWLLVDDAHGIGVRGEGGRGSCWQQGIKPQLLVVTFGKAFGVAGAAILCDISSAEYLLQFSRHLIYSTSMPPAQACALSAALLRVQEADERRQRLQQRIAQFRLAVNGLPLELVPSDTAIQPLLTGDNQRAVLLAQRLRERGLWVTAICPPTVPPGRARLRISLTALHQTEDINYLVEVLHDVCAVR